VNSPRVIWRPSGRKHGIQVAFLEGGRDAALDTLTIN
jgi:hypothetical protein